MNTQKAKQVKTACLVLGVIHAASTAVWMIHARILPGLVGIALLSAWTHATLKEVGHHRGLAVAGFAIPCFVWLLLLVLIGGDDGPADHALDMMLTALPLGVTLAGGILAALAPSGVLTPPPAYVHGAHSPWQPQGPWDAGPPR